MDFEIHYIKVWFGKSDKCFSPALPRTRVDKFRQISPIPCFFLKVYDRINEK